MKKSLFIILFFISLVSLSRNIVVIQSDQGINIINRNIYGHFAEHLGRCIYDGFYVGGNNKIPN